jgi:methyl-accepting chemotaxis protein
MAEAAERMSRRSSRPVAKNYADEGELDLRRLLKVLQGIRDGDFSVRLPGDKTGLSGKVADLVNEIASTSQRLAREIERAGQLVGKDGRTRHRITAERRSGSWGAMESSLNTLIDDLIWPTAEATRTISAVAKGDLSQLMRLEVDGRPIKGEFLRSATIVNSMIEQMRGFTSG